MNFKQCARCKLALPMSQLRKVIINNQGRKIQAYLCESCLKIVPVQEGK